MTECRRFVSCTKKIIDLMPRHLHYVETYYVKTTYDPSGKYAG